MEPFQVLGILTFVFAATLFSVGFLFPQVYYFLRLPEGHLSLEDENVVQTPTNTKGADDVDVKDVEEEPEEIEEHHSDEA